MVFDEPNGRKKTMTYAPTAPAFGGQTYEPKHDLARLTNQLGRVRELMADREWRTLHQIMVGIHGISEAGVSARLRDLRKPRHGGHTVERRRLGEPRNGLWEYRLLLRP